MSEGESKVNAENVNIITILSGFGIGAFLGAILGALITNKYNYHHLFAETVSKSRMEWINHFRDEVGIIVAALRIEQKEDCQKDCKKDCKKDCYYEAEKARARLLTRLNQDTGKIGNEYNGYFTKLLEGIVFSKKDETKAKEIIKVSRKILEPEWQRVKKEARGKS